MKNPFTAWKDKITAPYRLQLDEQAAEIESLKRQIERHSKLAQRNRDKLGNLQKIIDEQATELAQLRPKGRFPKKMNGRAGRKTKLTPEIIKEVQQLRADGVPFRAIAAKISLSVGVVHKASKITSDDMAMLESP